jgi:hypothetical protein
MTGKNQTLTEISASFSGVKPWIHERFWRGLTGASLFRCLKAPKAPLGPRENRLKAGNSLPGADFLAAPESSPPTRPSGLSLPPLDRETIKSESFHLTAGSDYLILTNKLRRIFEKVNDKIRPAEKKSL